MKKSALGDVLKIVAYVVACFLLAALISAPLYEMGKGFADVTLKKDTADELEWLAGKARKASFDVYFKRSLMLSALLLLFPLIYSLRLRVNPKRLREHPWSIYLPPETIARHVGQPLKKTRLGILQTLTGFFLASGLFLAMSWFLFQLNWFQWIEPLTTDRILIALKKAAPTAIGASVVEELLFRGVLLGIFLRAFRPNIAIIGLSLLFATLHFLQPVRGTEVSDPTSIKAGFEMLTLIGHRLLEPQLMLYEFASLFMVGLILAYARYGTASLWLPIGLHAGWIFALKIFHHVAQRRPDLPEKYDIYMGHDLKEGLIPLAALMLNAILVVIYVRMVRPAPLQNAYASGNKT